jgi:hypothetical protein
MKKINFFDNVEVDYSKAEVILYLLSSEVKSFIESGCPDNHIFVNAVTAAQLGLFDEGTDLFNIGVITENLLNNPNESESEKLIELVESYERNPDKFLNEFLDL